MSKIFGEHIRKIHHNESGLAFVMVLILLVIGSLLLPPVLNLIYNSFGNTEVFEKKEFEKYAADAGVEHALWTIYKYPDSYPHSYLLSENLNDASVNVTIEDIGAYYKITSVATTDGISDTTIECYAMYPLSMFDYAAAALDGDLTLRGTSTEITSYPDDNQADIYANGNIKIRGNVEVHGDATASGTIERHECITGNVTEHWFAYKFAELDTSGYWEDALSENTTYNTSQTYGAGDHTLGPAYIDGDLTIESSANVTLEGTVWVNGAITIFGEVYGNGSMIAERDMVFKGGSIVAVEDMPVFISTQGGIKAVGGNRVSAVLYAPNGKVTVGGSAGIFGSAVGKEVEIQTSSQLSYGIEIEGVDRSAPPDIIAYFIK